ncbi:MAG: phospholipase D-like domain-containing protein [Pseudomonadota bacterium]
MSQTDDFQVLITADEAWPAFERTVLNATKSVSAGFRIFDMLTVLRSDEARKVGRTWFDLLMHVLHKGVHVRLIVSDFDPVFATELHEIAWTTMRQAAALREISGCRDEQLQVIASLHPAKAGAMPWTAFLPFAVRRKSARLRQLSEMRKKRQAVRLQQQRMPSLHTTSHHQKIAVVDETWLYVGGLDLNERRYDDPTHDRPAEETWSDVQLLIRGPEAKEASTHLEEFVDVVHGKAAPTKLKSVKRTLSAPRRFQFPFLSPRTVLSEIEEVHRTAFRNAHRLVYVETQYFRARSLAECLAEQAQAKPDLAAIIILPGLPDKVAFSSDFGSDAKYGMALQADALDILKQAFGKRLTLATPVRPILAARADTRTLAGSPLVHVHNKVLVQDDQFALVGSANLNGRSLYWDTEVAVTVSDKNRVDVLRRRLMAHWWHSELPAEAKDPAKQQAWWHRKIAENGVVLPENRTGFLVPHDVDNLRDETVHLPGVTDNIV